MFVSPFSTSADFRVSVTDVAARQSLCSATCHLLTTLPSDGRAFSAAACPTLWHSSYRRTIVRRLGSGVLSAN